MWNKNEEIVLAVNSQYVRQEFEDRNYLPLSVYLSSVIEGGCYYRRDRIENNPDFKQVIPYVVVRAGIGSPFLVVERLKSSTETRLHNLMSLGIGGHVNPVFGKGGCEAVLFNAVRELEEELFLSDKPRITDLAFRGFINDDKAGDVERVHLGVVFEVRCEMPPTVRETSNMAGGFDIPANFAKHYYNRAERWSQIIFDSLLRQYVGDL